MYINILETGCLHAAGVVRKVEDYYSAFLKSENIRTEFSLPAGHAQVTHNNCDIPRLVRSQLLTCMHVYQITDDYGSICSLTLVPFINNCGYPSASVMLDFIYSGVKLASHTDAISANVGTHSYNYIIMSLMVQSCVS